MKRFILLVGGALVFMSLQSQWGNAEDNFEGNYEVITVTEKGAASFKDHDKFFSSNRSSLHKTYLSAMADALSNLEDEFTLKCQKKNGKPTEFTKQKISDLKNKIEEDKGLTNKFTCKPDEKLVGLINKETFKAFCTIKLTLQCAVPIDKKTYGAKGNKDLIIDGNDEDESTPPANGGEKHR